MYVCMYACMHVCICMYTIGCSIKLPIQEILPPARLVSEMARECPKSLQNTPELSETGPTWSESDRNGQKATKNAVGNGPEAAENPPIFRKLYCAPLSIYAYAQRIPAQRGRIGAAAAAGEVSAGLEGGRHGSSCEARGGGQRWCVHARA